MMKRMPKVRLDSVIWHHDAAAEDSIPTGYLHSYTKAVLTAIQAQEGQVDPVWLAGASGIAFRIWIHHELCPSATSVFDWSLLSEGVKNAGWNCDYYSRLWHEVGVTRERQEAAHDAIVKALQAGRVPVCWDIDVPEWGGIIGYDDEVEEYSAISVLGKPAQLKYAQLGRRDIPIMSVTIIKGPSNADRRQAAVNSLRTAVKHAEQGEWLDRPAYQDGLAAYETWAAALEKLAQGGEQRMLSYYSGTYLAARYYARRYMGLVAGILGDDKQLQSASHAYTEVVGHLTDIWRILSKDGPRSSGELREAAGLLRKAKAAEKAAIERIKAYLGE
ncbi:MAG: hypothetical protein ACOYEP_03795 [Limnochordia bacterium]